MEDFEGNQRYAEYKNFRVDDEKVKHGCSRRRIKNPFKIKLIDEVYVESRVISFSFTHFWKMN